MAERDIETRTFRRSSHLVSGEYDPETQQLDINFKNGTTYIYEGVDQETWEGLKEAPSAGKYFWRHIR